jgi:enoyl-CoA hydratase/carnithine racemase
MPYPRPPPSLPSSYNDLNLSFTQIRTEHFPAEPSIIILTLYRPGKYNAYTETMMQELEQVYAMFDVDDRVKCIVFTGDGKMFCAGADLEVGFVQGGEAVNDHRDG